jgi:apolipoprotein D and lipocalin family protein
MGLAFRTCLAGAAALLALLAAGCAATPSDPPETVERVDLERYTGRWYEIARIPNRFQDQCAGGTTAEYSLRDDGRIGVINRCVTEDGGIDEARGVARVVDPQTNARLEVSFVDLLGWQLFWGDYWILGLGPEYQWSLVGHPQRRYGWILSRTPSIAPATRERIDDLLRANGYDPGRFVDSPRPEGGGPDQNR